MKINSQAQDFLHGHLRQNLKKAGPLLGHCDRCTVHKWYTCSPIIELDLNPLGFAWAIHTGPTTYLLDPWDRYITYIDGETCLELVEFLKDADH